MKFTLELPALIRIVQQVGKKMPGQKRADPALRLYACAARVFQWEEGIEQLLGVNPAGGFRLDVKDESRPDCIPPSAKRRSRS